MTEQTITVKVTDKDLIEILSKGVAELKEENILLKRELDDAFKLLDGLTIPELLELVKSLNDENVRLKSENKRLTDKLNKTALELVDECISQGKATEISEMSYREFLDYRAENGKPMELQL